MTNGTRRGRGVSVTPRPLFTPRKDVVPIVQETWWSPGSVWTGAENLAPTGIRSPDRPAGSQLLYQLRYPAQGKSVPKRISESIRAEAQQEGEYYVRISFIRCIFHHVHIIIIIIIIETKRRMMIGRIYCTQDIRNE